MNRGTLMLGMLVMRCTSSGRLVSLRTIEQRPAQRNVIDKMSIHDVANGSNPRLRFDAMDSSLSREKSAARTDGAMMILAKVMQ